jgi:hypothetical protein
LIPGLWYGESKVGARAARCVIPNAKKEQLLDMNETSDLENALVDSIENIGWADQGKEYIYIGQTKVVQVSKNLGKLEYLTLT